ncbi:MAG: aminodeoxychorismate/anthranilate synthase component II [Bacteroidia bacterium]|nr:aminodeoxychorismate/anthranilate synthase component II [Bacteroidia bacterium]
MKFLLIDNYDSFTFNLYHYLLVNNDVLVDVYRNNQLEDVNINAYDGIILSPGPGLPCQAGKMPGIIQKYAKTKPFLGICLGHQGLGEYFGAKLLNLEFIHHGVSRETIHLGNSVLFKNLPTVFKSARYHSWGFKSAGFPSCLKVTSFDNAGIVMSFEHIEYPITGIQFHPESILTDFGHEIIENWVNSIQSN